MTFTRRVLPHVRRRLPTTGSTLAILAGDLVVLFAFIATGQYAHNFYFWEVPIHTIEVLLPFVIAWGLVSFAVGLFDRELLLSYTRTVEFVIPAWIGASLVGGAIRATAVFPGGAPLDFLLANIVFGLLFFVPWRLAATFLYRRSQF